MARRKPPEPMPASEVPLSKYQAFTVMRVARGDLKNAPYNPRMIDKHAASKLQEGLRKDGLIETLVWNKRTGNLVGGHQRISKLDALEGSDNYSLDVSVIDVDEPTEKHLNIALNNPAIQGEFDIDALAELFKDGVSWESAGFDRLEMEALFADSDLGSLFNNESEAQAQDIDDLAAMGAAGKAAKAPARADAPAPADDGPGDPPEGDDDDPSSVASIKARRREYKGDDQALATRDTEFTMVVVCASREEQTALVTRLGYPPDAKYVDSRRLMSHLGLQAPKTERA